MATKGSYTYDYPRPMLTADCVVVRSGSEVLLVRRGGEPFKGCWALPGGFMEMDETIEHCAVRELEEETGLRFAERDLRLIGVYSAPGRDPRGRTVTAAFRVESGERRAESGERRVESGEPVAATMPPRCAGGPSRPCPRWPSTTPTSWPMLSGWCRAPRGSGCRRGIRRRLRCGGGPPGRGRRC